tara:strand:- start:1513 stop:4605 length:3093 start_codon:yes stop_codon:yes gene_type:complete
MALKTISANNTSNLAIGDTAAIIGKNGFQTELGVARLVANAYAVDGNNIDITVENLDNLHDDNFDLHLLDVNSSDPLWGGLKGLDYVNIPVQEKDNSGALLGFTGYNPVLVDFSANIFSYDVSTNSITIENETTEGVQLIDILPDAPFYLKFNQILDPSAFANNTVYLKGTKKDITKIFDVSSETSGTYTANLGVDSRKKEFISLFIDGIKQTTSSFTFDSGTPDQFSVLLDGSEQQVKTIVDYYTVPTVEVGDTLSTIVDNNYTITETSFGPESANYNVALTANCIFKARVTPSIKANLLGAIGINISKDIVGTIDNIVDGTSFTINYSASSYPGTYNLGNNKIYSTIVPYSFDDLQLPQDRIIRFVPNGLNVVRARNVNTSGRRSPWVMQSKNVGTIPIQRVENLTLTEELHKDISQGVVIHVEVAFDHISNQSVTDYEVSYKMSGEASDTLNYQTVKVPSAGVDTDGKIRYLIADVERGRTSAVNFITVRVTPLNKDTRGVLTEKTQALIGKTAAPQGVNSLAGGQNGSLLFFSWDVAKNEDETVVDIDLLETLVRRADGTVDSADYATEWITASKVATVATPATSVALSVDVYGDYTFLFKTKDTSGNESTEIAGIAVSITRPVGFSAFKIYGEDDPAANNVIAFLDNQNYPENEFPSVADSNNFGLAGEQMSAVDNANGTSSGFTFSATTDINALEGAFYQTQVRDMGQEVTGGVVFTTTGSAVTALTFNDFHTDITDLVSDASASGTVFMDADYGGIGHLLGESNATAAPVSYSSLNRTLISGGTSGNVFALWNPGQYTGDVSNTNSFALIAGTINTIAVAVGNVFLADGTDTGGNNFANAAVVSSAITLVDLNQFSDDSGVLTFAGQDSVLSFNTEMRYATEDVYYANGNVNVAAFVDGTVNDGWKPYNTADRTFRYMQLKYTITNSNPNLSSYTVDTFNYVIELADKIYTTVANTESSQPLQVSYSSTEFLQTPTITMTPLNDIKGTPVVVNASNLAANVNVYNSSGTALSDVEFNFQAIGI